MVSVLPFLWSRQREQQRQIRQKVEKGRKKKEPLMPQSIVDRSPTIRMNAANSVTKQTSHTPATRSYSSSSDSMSAVVAENTSPFEVPGASPILPEQEMRDSDKAPHSQEAPMWEFPGNVELPSTKLVQSIYNEAINFDGHLTDQTDLANYGVYSFRDVLLPAVCCQHNDALKATQAILQRDHPDRVHEIKALRKCLVETAVLAQNAITKSADHRKDTVWPDLQRRQEAAQKSLVEQKSQMIELKRMSQKREMKKKLATNVESWREVANLMTDLQKMKKEEKVWKQALMDLESKSATPIATEDGSAMDTDEDNDPQESCSLVQIMETFDDVQSSCKRLEQHLGIVETAMIESEKLRIKVVEMHHREHFSLSQSSAGSKNVFRILSQEDPMAY